MDATDLIDATGAPGIPAPFWILQALKVLGFVLHMVPMNLWYAGIITAMLLRVLGGEQGRRFSHRLMAQMPILIAFGINFGIVPLLFIQTGYFRFFYPATILMAWPWFFVILWLIPAYYGVYLYAFGLRAGEEAMPRWRKAFGWISAVLFIVIGFTFANAMSLMTNTADWEPLWAGQELEGAAGAASGLALNVGDSTLWPRWLLMFGLALGTTAAWMVFDSAWFGRRENDEYRRWVSGFAPKLYTLGATWYALTGAWYLFLSGFPLRARMFDSWWLGGLSLLTALGPLLPLGLVWWLRRRAPADRKLATLIFLAHFLGVIVLNAITRQIVQNLELLPFDVAAQPTAVQWSPLILFLVLFVGALVAVVWMVSHIAHLPADAPK